MESYESYKYTIFRGGNKVLSCNYCKQKVTGSCFKVKARLLKRPNYDIEICKSMPDDVAQIIKKEHQDAERKKTKDEIK